MKRDAVGLSFRAEADAGVIEALSTSCARYEFPALSVWDDLGDPPPWPLLFALEAHDKTARLGVACLAVPKYASWDGIVGLMSSMASMRDGPLFIGLAPGAWLEQIGLRSARVQQIREAAAVIRYLWEHQIAGFRGDYYSVTPGFQLKTQTSGAMPSLMLGGHGPRMVELAGEIADEVKLGGAAAVEALAVARAHVAAGALKNGRQPEDIGIVMGAVTVVDEDGRAARAAARRHAAPYIAVVGARHPVLQADFPGTLEAIEQALSRGDLAAAAEAVNDDLLSRFAFAGTPAEVIEQIKKLLDAGASRVDLGSPHGLDTLAGIDLIGQRVLPYFRE